MVNLGVVKGSWDRNGGNVPEVRKVEVTLTGARGEGSKTISEERVMISSRKVANEVKHKRFSGEK